MSERIDLKTGATVAMAYLVISVIMFLPLVTNFMTAVPGLGGDVYQGLWELWWVPYSIFTLHTSPYFTRYIYYPVGANLITQTMAPLAGLISVPLQLISLSFAYNVIFLLGFVLAGLFAFMLAFHFTKNETASFLAGFIYAFSPIHVVQAFGHLQWINIGFIPLFILCYLLMLEEKKMKYALFAAISFLFLTFMGDLEQAALGLLFAILILIYYAVRKEKRQFLDRKFGVLFVEMLVAMFVLGSPAIIPIVSGVLNGALRNANLFLNPDYALLYSPDLLSYFVPSFMNGIFNGASASYYSIYAPAPAERVVYIGYSIMLLALFGLYRDYKANKLSNSGLWLLSAAFFLLLSVGPNVQINGKLSGIPGLYILYQYIPLLNAFIEPGRFDIAAELALAMLAAIGFSELAKREWRSAFLKSDKNLFAIFFVLLFIEYEAMPLSNAYLSNAAIPSAYPEIGNLTGNFTMLILPALPNVTSSAPARYPGLAMYYQTAFKKPLVGGYSTRSNLTQQLSTQVIPLVVEANFLEEGQGLTYLSPINENYTSLNLLWLASYRTFFIAVTRQAYNTTELNTLATYMYSVFGQPLYQSNTTIVFSTTNAIANGLNKQLVAYTSGTWIPGFSMCQSVYNCNLTFGNMWWGGGTRGIAIIAPPTKTHARMRFGAMGPAPNTHVRVYFNSPQNLIAILNLSNTPQVFTSTLNLTPGPNGIVFQTDNNTLSANPYLTFGMYNITFT